MPSLETVTAGKAKQRSDCHLSVAYLSPRSLAVLSAGLTDKVAAIELERRARLSPDPSPEGNRARRQSFDDTSLSFVKMRPASTRPSDAAHPEQSGATPREARIAHEQSINDAQSFGARDRKLKHLPDYLACRIDDGGSFGAKRVLALADMSESFKVRLPPRDIPPPPRPPTTASSISFRAA